MIAFTDEKALFISDASIVHVTAIVLTLLRLGSYVVSFNLHSVS